jgi:hypothetical protein
LESCNHTFHTRRNEEWKTIRRAWGAFKKVIG